MVTYGVARPVPGAGGMTDADWREFGSGLGDGIVNSTNPGGSSDFQVALSAGDRSVVLNLGQIRIRGVQFRPTPTNATVTFTLPTVAAGMTRSDRIVARYDPAAADTDKITFLQLNGTAVTTGSPVARPSITRVAGGVWDIALHLFTGANVTSDSLDREDHRIFATSHLHGITPPGNNTNLNSGYPDGSQFYNSTTGETWVQTYPAGVATWTNIDNPPWNTLTRGTGLVAPTGNARAAQWRVRRGELQMQGTLHTGTTAWTANTGGSLTEKSLGTLPASVATRIRFSRMVPVSLMNTGVGPAMARGLVQPDGSITFFMPPGVQFATIASFDAIRFALEP